MTETKAAPAGSTVAFMKLILALRWLVVPLAILAALYATSGARFLGFTNDYRYFFSEDNPYLAAFEQLERTYSSPDTLIWVIQPKEGAATAADVLVAVKDMTERAWQTPFSVRVDSIANFQHTRALEDDLIVRDLVEDPATLTAEGEQEVWQVASSEPAIAKRLIDDDNRTTAVMARLNLPRSDDKAATKAVMFGRELRDDMRAAYPDLRIEMTGSAALSNAFVEAAQSDVSTLTPLMFVILGLTVYLLLRSLSATIATMLVVGLSAAAALGTAGWLGIVMSPPTSNAPTIILTVAVADSIHILVTMLVEMRRGRTKREAIIESMRVNMTPVFLTSVTTAIGFASLNFSDAPPYHDLGNISAIGAIYAWILSITLLPALMMILPVRVGDTLVRQSDFMERFANTVIRLRYPLLVGMSIAIVGLATLLPTYGFSDRFVNYFDERIEFRRATDFMADNLTSIYQISYSVPARDSGGIADPDYLRILDDFSAWYREQPEVQHVATFTDVIKRVNKSMHGDEESYYRIPENRNEAAQYLLLYEMSLPYGLDLNDQINVDKSATKLTVTLDDISTAELRDIRERARNWLDENAPEYMRTDPAGQMVMFAFIGENNFRAMTLGTGVALVLISGCLMLALRHIRLGLISLIPNLTPPIAAFGFMALFIDNLGFWAAFVVATALGLIVDATVHLLTKYRRARDEMSLSPEDAVRYAFTSTGTALWVSTFVLIAGFAILALSPFFINAMLGLMVATTIAIAIIIDFLLLPAILITLDRDPPEKAAQEAADAAA